MAKKKTVPIVPAVDADYTGLLSGISTLLEQARRSAVWTLNSLLTASYWEIGRRIVEFEQGGKSRAIYGESLVERLAKDLCGRYGRGFSRRNVFSMRAFYLGWEICQAASGKPQARVRRSQGSGQQPQKVQTLSAQLQYAGDTGVPLDLTTPGVELFLLPWSHYVRLMAVSDDFARWFYEDEAIRGGWSVRQLDRQISTQFYERTALSRNKEAMLLKGRQPRPEDAVTVEETIRDPYLLEFLDLKDEYSETDLENSILQHLEQSPWRWARGSRLSLGRKESSSARSGITWTWYCSTAGCGAWS